MTEKTLLSGYKVGGKDNSLLKTIGNGIMIFSDFTSILAKNPVSRGEILSQLKLVYDRKVTKYTGTGKVYWDGKIGVLAGATPDIYYHLEAGRSMGERFLYVWLEQPTDEEIALKQSETTISAKEMTNIMAEYYNDYYTSIEEWIIKHGVPELKLSDKQKERIRHASMFCVNGKATVHVNFKTGKADQIPNKAGVGRDLKQYEALLMALQVMYCYETNDPKATVQDWHINIIEKCSYSSINRERRKVLEILSDNTNKPLSASEIGAKNGFGLNKEAVETYLIPLHAVGLIKKQIVGNSFKWFIENEDTLTFIKKIRGSVQEVPMKILEDEEVIDDKNEEFDQF
jgi:Fe2+ or Zn2+ uptake regulation protein